MSTDGFWSTICAERGPDMSPFRMSRPSTTMPSVVVMPTRRPISFRMWAIIRTVVVLPLVPVTRDDRDARVRALREEQVDHRLGDVLRLAFGRIGVHPEAGRGVDLDDRPALLAHRARSMSGTMKSIPATSRPTTWAAVSAISTLSGCASCVRSIDVPPVDMLPVAASITRWPFFGHVVERQALLAEQLLRGRP